MWKQFRDSQSGNFAIFVAIIAAPLMGALALAVDYATIHSRSSELQELADSAALAAAKELSLSNSKSLNVEEIATNYASSRMKTSSTEKLVVKADQNLKDATISVSLSYYWKPFFAQYINPNTLPIVASAKAGLSGGNSSVCVLALDPKIERAIDIGSKSSITAKGCSIFSNSSSSAGLSVEKGSKVSAESIQVSGGYNGSDIDFQPLPITDSPSVVDPLGDRLPPSVGLCDHNGFSISGKGTYSLKPGVYCSGLHIGGSSVAKLEPGMYVVKDGPLSVQGNASIIGDHVGFYFVGLNATFDFGVSTQAVLSAPDKGALSGILFFEDRNSGLDRDFTIRSKDAEKFEGTIYLPNGRLFIDKASRVGQTSNWTAFVVKRFAIGKGPQLVVNSDYDNSDVPVPDGISTTGDIRLFK